MESLEQTCERASRDELYISLKTLFNAGSVLSRGDNLLLITYVSFRNVVPNEINMPKVFINFFGQDAIIEVSGDRHRKMRSKFIS